MNNSITIDELKETARSIEDEPTRRLPVWPGLDLLGYDIEFAGWLAVNLCDRRVTPVDLILRTHRRFGKEGKA